MEQETQPLNLVLEVEETQVSSDGQSGSDEEEWSDWDDHPLSNGLVEGTEGPSGGESGNEWLERKDHPLLNSLILDTVLGFVRRYDLLECRLVRKIWNDRTIPHMRATFKVSINGSQSSHRSHQIEDFVNLFNGNVLGMPFGKFDLAAFSTADGVGQGLIKLIGKTTTEIYLGYPFDSETYTIEYVSELLRSCPNLKAFVSSYHAISLSGNIVKLFPDFIPTFSELKKITFQFKCEDRLRFCPTFIEELMMAAPNVSDIASHKTGCKYFDKTNVSTISVVLNEIEKLGKESTIQALDLHNFTTEDIGHLERMGKNGLKLKSLNLIPKEATVESNEFQIQLATIFKDTLQHLGEGEWVGNTDMEYPRMPNLESLYFRIFPTPDHLPVNWKFPAVKTLELEISFQDEKKEWSEYFSRVFRCPTVKSLFLNGGYMKIHTFQNIQRAFPHLTKLHFQLDEGEGDGGGVILRRIWSQMTQLESLSIVGDVLGESSLKMDSLFTGIPIKILKKIQNIVKELDKMSVEERREMILKLTNEYSRFPSIRNLTNLKHLSLELTGIGGMNRKSHRLSDITGYLAFYSMIQLRQLDVCCCKFTKPCCEILKKETGLEYWMIRNKCSQNITPRFHKGENKIVYFI